MMEDGHGEGRMRRRTDMIKDILDKGQTWRRTIAMNEWGMRDGNNTAKTAKKRDYDKGEWGEAADESDRKDVEGLGLRAAEEMRRDKID